MIGRPDINRTTSSRSKLHRSEEVRVSAVQEEAEVRVKPVETGTIRVKKIAHEEFEPLALTLHGQNVDVKRVTVGRPVNEKFGERREGGTLTIPVFEYVRVVPCNWHGRKRFMSLRPKSPRRSARCADPCRLGRVCNDGRCQGKSDRIPKTRVDVARVYHQRRSNEG